MRRITWLIVSVLLFSGPSAGMSQPGFDDYFINRTLRIDLYHTGTADEEVFSLDELVEEPCWAGNPRALIDTMNLGGYIFRVFDLQTNNLIYSRGYCSIFGEWATTGEAERGFTRTFHESVLLPYPRRPIQVRIDRRDRRNIFRNVFDLVVDPSDYHIRNRTRFGHFKIRKHQVNGPAGEKVDIVVIADGYRKDQMHKFRDDAKRLLKGFFSEEPFLSRRSDFNVRLIEAVSDDTGIDDPRMREYRNNIAGLSFNSLDLDRYMLSTANKALRDIAGSVPYDFIMVLANTEKYGGGGIFNLFATSSADNEYSGYVFVHEFGHSFGGLGDEYYSSAVIYNEMYPGDVEPWEPNITALLDTTDVKWGDLIAEGTPVPTPDDSTFADVVGCFEGAGYSAKGLYRPYRDCIMFSKNPVGFCPVCRKAIERMIDFYTR